MFDLAWSEIVLIGVVALIAIGPKDLPVAMKAVTEVIKKARRMAGEFQTHVDDMMRDANLDEVRSQINEIRNFDLKGIVEKHVDGDGSLRSTLSEDPFNPVPAVEVAPSEPESAAAEPVVELSTAPVEPKVEDPLAFLPPAIAKPPAPPAFLPPGTTLPTS